MSATILEQQPAVDMTFSFMSGEEPTDAQWETLMREVGEDARKRREETNKALRNEIRLAVEKNKADRER
ncbi:hypothetical protein Barb7_01191 [Bacteroidales bacterium Barb7]|nr:hypothetical protein Barb7_01191 [Bacteroidales bacterium Barb7]